MKKHLFLFFIVFYTISFAQLTNGLKAYYPFGGNTNDYSGLNNNGTIIGNASLTSDRFGTSNCAYQFSGSNDNYIKINYSNDFNIPPTGTFSISLWFKGGSAASGDLEILFGKQNPQYDYKPYDYYLGLYDGNKVLCGGVGYEALWSSIFPPMPDPNWHHIVFIYDNKNWYLYQDNILRGSDTSQTRVISQSTYDLVIGKGFQGVIDDVRFYDRKLATEEISLLYNLAGSCEGLSTLEDVDQSMIAIFPNPTNNLIHIKRNTNNPIKVSIFDNSGKEVFNNQYFLKDINVDLSKFVNGTYIIKTNSDGVVKSQKIIKKN